MNGQQSKIQMPLEFVQNATVHIGIKIEKPKKTLSELHCSIRKRIIKNTIKDSGCWVWTGDKDTKGYGRIRINGKKYSLHRTAYRLFVGPILNGIYVCHKCDIKLCANPDHLFLGTAADNSHDRDNKGRTKLHIENLKIVRSKFTKDQIALIMEDRRPLKEIAAQYDICVDYASKIRKYGLKKPAL